MSEGNRGQQIWPPVVDSATDSWRAGDSEEKRRQGVVMENERRVLDHIGFVRLVDVMGDDYRVLQSARVSTGGDAAKGDKKDKALIRYLYKNKHLTPFEQVVTTWHVKAPIFTVRQWMRHRTQSFNEYSSRYSEMPDEIYMPTQLFKQSNSNHQGSGDELSTEETSDFFADMNDIYREVFDFYDEMIETGVAKEQARMVLPVSQYTEFYTTVNLRNLFHFLALRLDNHAQFEIRMYAEAMLSLIKDRENLKWSVAAFEEFNELEQIFNKAVNASKTDTSGLADWLRQYVAGLSS